MLIRISLGLALASQIFLWSSLVSAQSTPSELASLQLEDLLNIEMVSEGETSEFSRFSFDYAYRYLDVGGYLSGNETLSFDEVLFEAGEVRTQSNYPVVPTYISQQVHSLSLGYRLFKSFEVKLMAPYVRQRTSHISSVPGFAEFDLSTDGIGDAALYAVFRPSQLAISKWQFSMGMSFPTGSIDETGDTPRNGTGTLERLPYTMQIGSGTYDVLVSGSYTSMWREFDFGATAGAIIRTGTNKNGYALGNSIGISVWSGYRVNQWFQPSLNLSHRYRASISGADESLMVPAAFKYPASITDPANFGGNKFKLGLGVLSCLRPDCSLSLRAEFSVPVYQHLNGVQPKENKGFSTQFSVRF